MKYSENSGKIVSALLVGGIIGGALGILFSPEKGARTRKRIADYSEDFTETIEEKFNDFLKEARKSSFIKS